MFSSLVRWTRAAPDTGLHLHFLHTSACRSNILQNMSVEYGDDM